ncbi:OXA1-like protein [Ophiocordyceps camponoti-floridani]|uniref:OXA1-like protein n=1 Tax=Ophiocordyceps camponoti-floridani TaxID=2030778 RepID=A0A8H4Q7I5_9HYPO|nr:OXA1-like protein [Ophiocordyceps camponoti-floridani]
MLPSRGAPIVFSGAKSRIPAVHSFVFAGTGRRFGTLRQGGPSPWSSRRRRLVVGASGPSATRQLSLWGWSPSLPGWPSSVPGWAWITGSDKSKAAPEAELIPPVQTVAVETTANPLEAIPSTEIDTSLLSEALTAEDILSLPVEPGYLGALGLDYGWGPTSVMQWTMEHVHVYTGLGWSATIVATAVLLRFIMLYPQYRSLKFGVAMQRMKADPRAEAALKLGREGAADRNLEKQMQSRMLYKMLRKEYGFSSWGMMWSIGQVPFGYGLFRLLNGMAGIPVPSFESAGWLWFPDLAAKDPYFVLPVVGTTLMILSVTLTAKYNPAANSKFMKPMAFAIGAVGLVITSFLSSAVNLMTSTLAICTVATTLLFNTPPSAASSSSPSTNPLPQPQPPLPNSMGDAKKGISEQISNMTGSQSISPEIQAARRRRDLLLKAEASRKQARRADFDRKYNRAAR